jgi:hypothetical protein
LNAKVLSYGVHNTDYYATRAKRDPPVQCRAPLARTSAGYVSPDEGIVTGPIAWRYSYRHYRAHTLKSHDFMPQYSYVPEFSSICEVTRLYKTIVGDKTRVENLAT